MTLWKAWEYAKRLGGYGLPAGTVIGLGGGVVDVLATLLGSFLLHRSSPSLLPRAVVPATQRGLKTLIESLNKPAVKSVPNATGLPRKGHRDE